MAFGMSPFPLQFGTRGGGGGSLLTYLPAAHRDFICGGALRRLTPTYVGALVRVRRSNDNDEIDIGFNNNGHLDSNTLLGFTGANSSYVTTLYDQNGIADFVQATTTYQPRIVNAGVLDTKNGRPALYFNTHYMAATVSWELTNQSVFAVASLDSNAGGATNFGRIFTQSDAGNDYDNTGHYVPIARNGLTEAFASFAGSAARESRPLTYGTLAAMSSIHSGSSIVNAVNQSVSSGYVHTLDKTFTRIRIGVQIAGTLSGYFIGNLSEILVYASDKTDARQTIKANQGKYFSIGDYL